MNTQETILKKHNYFLHGLGIGAVTLFLDQLHKYYMLYILGIGELGYIKITSFFNIVLVWNPGISFGMFSNTQYGKYIFTCLAIGIVIFMLVWLKRTNHKMQMVALALISGGAIGNIIDRVLYGKVADFFDLHIGVYHWPAFNIADSAVTIGAILLLIDGLFLQTGAISGKEGKDSEKREEENENT